MDYLRLVKSAIGKIDQASPGLVETASKLIPPADRYRKLLLACCQLQEESIMPPCGPFAYGWVTPGKGYPAVCSGHWDLVHACLDALPYNPTYVREQILNYFSQEKPNGMLPGITYACLAGSDEMQRYCTSSGSIWTTVPTSLGKELVFCSSDIWSHPPVWPFLVEDYYSATKDLELLKIAYEFGNRNLKWWKEFRCAREEGFYYYDIIDDKWESGVDQGVRFINRPSHPCACVDATCHIYKMVDRLASWAGIIGVDNSEMEKEGCSLRNFIQTRLWDEKSGFFYDAWMIEGETDKIKSFEGFWPLVTGAATKDQAVRLLDHLLSKREFFAYHPIATVALDERSVNLDMWRGNAWNSMTYWMLRGCMDYGFAKEVRKIGNIALDRTLEVFERDHTIYEFYNSTSADIARLKRKGEDTGPFRDYIGHNPLNALWWRMIT